MTSSLQTISLVNPIDGKTYEYVKYNVNSNIFTDTIVLETADDHVLPLFDSVYHEIHVITGPDITWDQLYKMAVACDNNIEMFSLCLKRFKEVSCNETSS